MVGEWTKSVELDRIADQYFKLAQSRIFAIVEGFLAHLERMGEKEAKKYLAKKRITYPISTKATIELAQIIHSALVNALLLGMQHVMPEEEYAEPQIDPIPFEEAEQFFKTKIPLTHNEFYALERQMRFRAFTVARLSDLDAINKVKERLLRSLNEGKTLKDFWEVDKEREALLYYTGFHDSNPYYWETVYRTNIQSAYNAGRYIQIKKSPQVKYLRFIGIRDRRQSRICKARDGVVLPSNDPWWETNWPPLHFNCRSSVAPIYEDTKPTSSKKLKDIPPPQKYRGDFFGGNPIETQSFWGLTPAMRDRARQYGILTEIKKFAKHLGIKNYRVTSPSKKQLEKSRRQEESKTSEQKIQEIELLIINRKMEKAYLFDDTGKIVFQKSGGKDYVKFTKNDLKLFKNRILTHNHPNGSSLSLPDVNIAYKYKLKEIRAIGRTLTDKPCIYKIRIEGEIDIEKINQLYYDMRNPGTELWDLFNKYYSKLTQKGIPEERAQNITSRIHTHVVWKKISQKYPAIKYKREVLE